MKVRGKVWVVTGADSGMGRELARQLVERGARVAAVDRNPDALVETEELVGAGSPLSVHVVDITDRDAVLALPTEVVAAHGVIDGLINNAGIVQPFTPVAAMERIAIDRVLSVNLTGTLNMVEAFLPHLLERPEAHLANVSSMGGFFPFPGQTIYGASKAAVRLLTEGLYAELLDSAVRVSVIMPGAVNTPITQNSGVVEPTPAGGAEDILTSAAAAARTMIKGIERNRLHIYVGPDAVVLSVLHRLMPRASIRLIKMGLDKVLQQPPVEEQPLAAVR